MSLFSYQIECENCKTAYTVPFSVVGTTVLTNPPTECTNCGGKRLRNLPMFPRVKGEAVI